MAADQRPLLVSFGGAYSNHLSALATAGRLYQLPVIIYVRGKEVDNPLLRQAEVDGADIIRISRTEYRRKQDPDWQALRRQELSEKFRRKPAEIIFIPEGGTTPQGLVAMSDLYLEITKQLKRIPEYICLSAGTGGTAAGLVLAANPATTVDVYPALKGDWMAGEISRRLPEGHPVNWSCVTDYHFGGYGKFPEEWIIDAPGLAKRASIGPGLPPLDPIYTAKLFYGVLDRLRQGKYPAGSTVVVIHTGGIY